MLHQIGIYIHMVALLIIAGGSFGFIIIEKQLWIKIQQGSLRGQGPAAPLGTAINFIMTGITLFLLSGLLMLGALHWVYFFQGWYCRNLSFVTPLAKGRLFAKPIMILIGNELGSGSPDTQKLMMLKKRLGRFHPIQYCIFGYSFAGYF